MAAAPIRSMGSISPGFSVGIENESTLPPTLTASFDANTTSPWGKRERV